MTMGAAAAAGIGPMKRLRPTRPNPQICTRPELIVIAVSYLYSCAAQAVVLAILLTRTWFHNGTGLPRYVSSPRS